MANISHSVEKWPTFQPLQLHPLQRSHLHSTPSRTKKKPPAPTREQINEKHDTANKHRNTPLSFVIQHASEHFNEAKKMAHRLESKNNSDTESLLLHKLKQKMNEANDRKEKHFKTTAAKY